MNKIQNFLSKIFRIKVAETFTGIASDEEPGFVRITHRNIKGLDMITRDKQLMIVFSLYMKNPFAKTIIDTINDFIFGDGFSYDIEVKNEKTPQYKIQQARNVLDKFWELNKMDLRLEKKGIDLSLNGMLCLPVFINKQGGEVRLGFADPQNIHNVIYNQMNVEDISEIRFKQITGNDIKILKVIKVKEDDIMSDSFGLLDGECFFFCINNVSNQPEGVSDLLVSADIIDEMEELIFNILGHSKASFEYYQDITVNGANDTAIKEWKKKNPIEYSKNGESKRLVHNDKVKSEYKSPDLKASNSTEIVRMFKNIILLSKRMPEHWFADGGNSNLATAVEQGTAVFRFLKSRQQYWVYILEQILTFVLHQAFVNNKEGFSLTKEDLLNNFKIKIIVPEFEIKSLDKVSTSINSIADFIKKGSDNKWISPETAGKIFRGLTELFGYTIEEDVENEKLLNTMELEPTSTQKQEETV